MDFLTSIVIIFVAFLIGLFQMPVDQTSSPQPEVHTPAEVTRVIDGDTIIVSIHGNEERVRYIGIDTPELAREGNEAECYAKEAKARNQALLEEGTGTLVGEQEDRDKYHRLLRYVYVEEILINEVLIKEGYATILPIPPNTKMSTYFKILETKAQKENKGLWGSCGSLSNVFLE